MNITPRGDSTGVVSPYDLRQYMQFYARADHQMMVHLNWPYWHLDAGTSFLELKGDQRDGIYRSLRRIQALGSLSKWSLLPFLSAGAVVGNRHQLDLQADLLPQFLIKAGFRYVY